MRKMTALGVSALLAVGLVAAQAAAPVLAVSSDQGVGVYLAESADPAGSADVAPPLDEDSDELAATGASTAVGFALIAVALIGGGVTLTVLRRKGAFDA